MQAVPGMGIHGKLNDQEYRIGKIDLLKEGSLTENEINNIINLEKQGKTIIFVESNNQILGVLAIQDTLRSEAKEAVKLLKDMGIKVFMLTGDSSSTAKAIGQQAGVDEVFAELLPEG